MPFTFQIILGLIVGIPIVILMGMTGLLIRHIDNDGDWTLVE